MPNLYSYRDDGSPWMPDGSGSYRADPWTAEFLDRLFGDTLYAILVTGYGGNTGLGWTRTHANPGHCYAYKPPSGLYEVVIVRRTSSWQCPVIYLAESVSSYPAALEAPVGENVRSFNYHQESNQGGHVHSNHLTSGYGHTPVWGVVADETFFALTFDFHNAGVWTFQNNNSNHYSLYVGEMVNEIGFSGLPNICAIGGSLSNFRNTGGVGNPWPFSVPATTLRHPLTGLVTVGSMPRMAGSMAGPMVSHQTNWDTGGFQSPPSIEWNPDQIASPKVHLSPIAVIVDGVRVGRLKGLCYDVAWTATLDYTGAAAKALGILDSPSWTGVRDTFCYVRTLPDSTNYMLGGKGTQPFVMTDSPVFDV